MAILHGQQGVIRYVEETTPGTTPTDPALLLHSPEVQDLSFFIDKDLKESLDIGEVDVHELFSAKTVYGVSVTFHVYEVDKVFDVMERQSDNTPRSYTLEIIPNQDEAGAVRYIRGTGWRPKTVNLSGEVGEAWSCTVEYDAGVWAAPTTTDPGIGTGSRQLKSGISEGIKTFASGAITLDGAAWATLVGGLEITVDHGTEAGYTTGNDEPIAAGAMFGVRKITGTADISLDNGMEDHWDIVVASAEHTIEIPFGTTMGDPQIDLAGVKFGRLEGALGVDVKNVMSNVPFQASGSTAIAETTVA